MTKIDIFSGFLGAGKTTLIKKLIKEAYAGEKLMLIENEFGEISVDGGFLQDAGVEITEMSSGCICCSLVGDFAQALEKVKEQFSPDRILIEPSGVGKLSDVIKAVTDLGDSDLVPGSFTTVVDAARAKMHMRNFGEFWINQVESAGTIVLSRTAGMAEDKLSAVTALLREHNATAVIVTTPWEELDGKTLRAAMEEEGSLRAELARLAAQADDDDDDHDHCGHEHGDEGCEEHHHHHGHHADEVFTSWGVESPRRFTEEELRSILTALDGGAYGQIVRSKGIVPSVSTSDWIYFDFVPGEINIRGGSPGVTGRICVIGSHIDETALKELFKVG